MSKPMAKWLVIGRYYSIWVGTIMLGFITYTAAYAPFGDSLKGEYVRGLMVGMFGSITYFLVWGLLSPVVKWLWGKISHKEVTWLEVIR